MQVELSPNEMWKILDAVVAYKKDYSVTASVSKTISNIETKLKQCLKESK